MNNRASAAEVYRRVYAWFDTPLGRSLQAFEINRLREVLPSLYGTVAVQIGRMGKLESMDACVTATRILLDVDGPDDSSNSQAFTNGTSTADGYGGCIGVATELPFDAASVNLVLLPHTLDFSEDPRQILREVNRVLAPEGHAVILGFNPISFWGLRRVFTRGPRPAPWCANFLRLARVKDWLALLDFELTHGSMFYYRPPLQHAAAMDRLRFLDKMGDRWWPMMAATYLLVAKKRVVGMTPLRVSWKTRPRLVAGGEAAAPIPRISSARSPVRRVHNE
jgi:SAM-dependent methyltransferase